MTHASWTILFLAVALAGSVGCAVLFKRSQNARFLAAGWGFLVLGWAAVIWELG